MNGIIDKEENVLLQVELDLFIICYNLNIGFATNGGVKKPMRPKKCV
jgi:hypothetical protein